MNEPREVTTWYLQMLTPGALLPARAPARPHRIEHVVRPTAAFARYLYRAVGANWHWTDRLEWPQARWEHYLAREAVQLHTLQLDGAPAGYVELEWQPQGDVQLAYFGLLPELMGLGFGGWLLTRSVELAWQMPAARRVWVHTCTLDAEHALANYQKRGFTLYKTETRSVQLEPGGAWP